MIKRSLAEKIKDKLHRDKAIVLLGPRQVGKTTLIDSILKEVDGVALHLNGDDQSIREMLSHANTSDIETIIGNHTYVFVDEAQRINGIGLFAKIVIDHMKGVQLILSGSSAFELNDQIYESLTGRKWSMELYPISWEEYEQHKGYVAAAQSLDNRLVHGFYPDVINNPSRQTEILYEVVESYLYKDVLTFAKIRRPQLIEKLLRALAFQVGNEVQYKEVADLIGIDPKTVAHYMDILEKAYVVFRLEPLAKNLRNEIKKNRKIYFYDNGVRNALINSLQPIPNRNDVGALWENFLVSERRKYNEYRGRRVQRYFWRTKQGQEIDYIEEKDNMFDAFEFKWSPKKYPRLSKTFTSAYSNHTFRAINRTNFRDFIM